MNHRTSRRAALFLLAAATLSLTSACRGKHSRVTVENEEPEGGPRIASSLKMSDPAAAQQLVKGFFGLEGGTWRWTAKNFTALLRPPLASPQRGAILTFALTVPPVVIEKTGAITLSAASGSTKLKSETYSQPGNYSFTAEVPPDLLTKEAITLDFSLDKSITAGSADTRELGVIAVSLGLESK
jgi:hypothetical protein